MHLCIYVNHFRIQTCAIKGMGTVCIVGIRMHVLYAHMANMLMQCLFLCVYECVWTTVLGTCARRRCQVGSSVPPDSLEPAQTWQGCKLPRLGFRQLRHLLALHGNDCCQWGDPASPPLLRLLISTLISSVPIVLQPPPPTTGWSSLLIMSPNVCCTCSPLLNVHD